MRSVSGLLLTTANLAEVVSGLPTSGLKAKTSGAAGDSGSACGRAFVEQQARRRGRCRRGNSRSSVSASGTALPSVTSMRHVDAVRQSST